MRIRARCPACDDTSPTFDPESKGAAWAWWINHRTFKCLAEGEPLPTDPPLEIVA